MTSILVATLGAEPQVVTLTTELLLRQGMSLCAVEVLHTDVQRSPIDQSHRALQSVFADPAANAWPPLRLIHVPTADVLTPVELEIFADVLYETLQRSVAQGLRIHLLLAGGRKAMAMVGMSVAHILLGPEDAVWTLYSDEALRLSGRMRLAENDNAQLLRVPLPRSTLASPYFTPTAHARTRTAALAAQERERMRQAHYFLNTVLTPAERALATLIATEIVTVDEMARRLYKSPKTITNQLTTIYSKLENTFGLQPDYGVKREFLRQQLGLYLNDAVLAPD